MMGKMANLNRGVYNPPPSPPPKGESYPNSLVGNILNFTFSIWIKLLYSKKSQIFFFPLRRGIKGEDFSSLSIYTFLKSITLIFALTIFTNSCAQSFFEPADSLNKKRVLASHLTLGLGYSTSMIGLAQVWYKNQESQGFQFFDDSKDWLQMDKIGHTYTAYWMQNRAFALYQWSGMEQSKALLYSSLFSVLFMSTFEIMDGFSPNYGFSWADVGANSLGIGLFSAQQHFFGKQHVTMKFSYSHSSYAQYRPELLGNTAPERLLKDYNGQTYWFSLSLASVTPESWRIPDWLCLSFGYSISEKLKSDTEFYTVNFNNAFLEFNAYRRYFLSFDIDLSKIPVKKPWLKMLLGNFNFLKIPLPTIEFSNRNAPRFYVVYF
jgi:hypothetical protein